MERSHRYLEDTLGSLTLRLDGFFGDDSRLELDRPGTFARWRNELRFDDRGRVAARTDLRLALELPSLRRWFKRASLVIAGASTPDPTGRAPEEASSPGYSPSLRSEQASLELRVDLHRQPAILVQAAAGVRPHWDSPHLEPVARIHFHERLDVGLGIEARLVQELSWTGREKGGEKTRVDFDRPMGEDTDLRWITAGGISEASRGYEWASDIGVVREFRSLKAGATLAAAAVGHTMPTSMVDLYRVYLRLRRSLWRSWLVAELEPAVEWPADATQIRTRLYTITFRLEVQFDGRAPPPPLPEPARPGGAGFR